jgi:Ca2+-transporting ATPase
MAFSVLAISELIHVFNVRNNEKSIFKTGILSNIKLILAIGVSFVLVLAILLVPALREIFSIVVLPKENIFEVIILVLSPLIIVEIMKLLKINTFKNEQ